MKKSLTTAILVGLSTSSSIVTADTTLYGRLHASLDAVDVGSPGTNVSHSNNSSRIGVKGSEKISDALQAIYHAEFSVAAGGGSTTVGNRNQYVGLKGSAGTLLMGRKDTPFKKTRIDMFSDELGTFRPLTGGVQRATGGTATTWNTRTNNTIQYNTPKMGGFKASLHHQTEQVNNGSDLWSANAFYKTGGLLLGAGFERNTADDEGIRLVASYDTGKIKVSGFVQDTNSATAGGKETDVWNISASMKTAKGKIKGQYSNLDDSDANTDDGATMWAVGYDHFLSKRTKVYAQYASVENDSAGLVGLGGHGHGEQSNPSIAGEDVSGISLGIKHSF